MRYRCSSPEVFPGIFLGTCFILSANPFGSYSCTPRLSAGGSCAEKKHGQLLEKAGVSSLGLSKVRESGIFCGVEVCE